ncbi:MAG: ABC transporter permease, partial [Sphingobacteriales bacterium]
MIRNYIKSAIRSLQKNKGFTAINILGLALGITTCMLIVFYVVDELSYDKFNIKADRIYRVNNNIKFGGNDQVFAVSPAPLAQTLSANYPDVEKVTRLRNRGDFNVKKGDREIR